MGLYDEEFWNLTLAEIDRRHWAFLRHAKQESDDQVTTAWLVAVFSRQRRLRSLNMILNPLARKVEGEEKAQLDAQHADMIKAMEG